MFCPTTKLEIFMIGQARSDWFNRHKPKPPAARPPCVLPGPAATNVPDRVHATVSNPLADRVEGLMIRILNASAPIPLPLPGAPEVFKPGTRRVVSGPIACRRWGDR